MKETRKTSLLVLGSRGHTKDPEKARILFYFVQGETATNSEVLKIEVKVKDKN